MAAPKLTVFRGLLAKEETAYGDATAVANTTDGVLVINEMVPGHEYLHTGERRANAQAGAAGNMRKVAPSGAGISWSMEHEAKGAAAAYSASAVPSVHRLLKAAGFTGAVTTTGGSEKWDYTPTPKGTTPTSLSVELYGRETKFPANGVYCDMTVGADQVGDIPLWTFSARGRRGTVADSAIPAITYPTLTTEPPKTTTLTFTMGDFVANAVVRSWNFALNRELSPRGNMNVAGGHAGWSPGRIRPMLDVVIEATDLVGSPYHTAAGLDPYLFYENATEVAFSLLIGATQYNKWKLIPGKVQMATPPVEEADGPTALWRLSLQCNPTTANGSDDVTFRFD